MAKHTVTSLLLTAAFSMAEAQDRQPIAITHVTVIDVRTGNRLPDQTVVTRGNRIATMGPSASAPIPQGTRVVDATGRFLIPGLWDMHVHAAWPGIAQGFAPLFIANGVTGVRETWGARPVINAWRQWQRTGSAIAPRIVASGNLVDGSPPIWPTSLVANNANDARRIVDSLQRDGADFIKVYSRLNRETYFAIADQSKRRGIPFEGHVPALVSAFEASETGQKTFEHLYGIASACSSRSAELEREFEAMTRSRPDTTQRGMQAGRLTRVMRETYDAARCDSLNRRLVANGNWQVPTLTVLRGQAWQNDTSIANDPRLRYFPPSMVQGWDWRQNPRARIRSEEAWTEVRASFEHNLKLLGAMSRSGVPILAGTDVLNPYCMPGFSLHDELQLLVRAGLTPLAALQAATLNPARFLAATDSLGSVEIGKVADLLLLDADPLVNIANTQRIRSVIADGRIYDRSALDKLLADAERAAKQ